MALWTQFYSDMGIQVKSPLLAQAVSQEIFNKLLIQSETRPAKISTSTETAGAQELSLTNQEHLDRDK